MEAPINDPAESERQSRKARRYMLFVFTLLLLVTGTVILQDGPPPDDSWMMPHFTSGDGEHNALAIFCSAMKERPIQGVHSLSTAAYNCEKGAETEMRDFVSHNQGAGQAFGSLVATNEYGWRWPGGGGSASVLENPQLLSNCQDMVNLLQRMRVTLLAQEGRGIEATEAALNAIRFGHGLQGSEAPIIHWLVAVTCQMRGEDLLRPALTASGVDQMCLQHAQEVLAPLEPRLLDLRFSLQAEYCQFKGWLDQIKFGSIPKGYGMDGQASLLALLLRHNKTQAGYLYFGKPVIEALGKDWAAVQAASASDAEVQTAYRANRFRLYVSGNAGGNFLVSAVCAGLLKVPDRGVALCATHRQVSLQMALRRFELAKGYLPENLADLVPAFIPSVPQDPYDNAPMRWNPEKKVLYAVGKDLKDDRGKISEPRRTSDADFGMRYWWQQAKDEDASVGTKRRRSIEGPSQ